MRVSEIASAILEHFAVFYFFMAAFTASWALQKTVDYIAPDNGLAGVIWGWIIFTSVTGSLYIAHTILKYLAGEPTIAFLSVSKKEAKLDCVVTIAQPEPVKVAENVVKRQENQGDSSAAILQRLALRGRGNIV